MSLQGLTNEEVKQRLIEYGSNIIEEKRKTPLFLQFLGQFKDTMVLILIAASVIAYLAGEGIDAIIIFGIVILNAAIGFIQEFKAERAVEALKKLLAPRARVMRDGQELLVDVKDLVPGDLMILNEGDKVGADAEMVEENEIRVDESILTGESVPVSKDVIRLKKIFMGTQIAHGTGKAVVTHTGMRTEFGKIAKLTTETKKDKSPLQKELGHIGVFVGKVTIGISFILFLIGIFAHGRGILDTLLFAVSVAVAAVPEGLPATITVALALGVQRMARKNAIVKQLQSVETLGSTTVICSDKTGTLTKNEMTVQEIVLDNDTYDITVRGVGYEPRGALIIRHQKKDEAEYFEYEKKDLPELGFKKPHFYKHFELAMRAAALCNNARLIEKDGAWHILGDPTEGALTVVSEKVGFKASHFGEKHKRISELPFDSIRKRMSVISEEHETKQLFAYVKGAPDSLLPLCTHTIEEGRTVPLTDAKRKALIDRNENMAHRALRTIAVAYREIPPHMRASHSREEIEKNLVFLGLFAMMDPPREEVKEAVRLTRKAGIRIFIITGDHGLTANAVARELGIVASEGATIVTGDMMDTYSDEKLKVLLGSGAEVIFARVSPQHKLRIVDILKQNREIVAVTGDGVNDAPALKRADIGIAMGITGTDVSKEAANMVLADDSFSSIISAVVEGRTIYENMKKFIYFIFAANIGEVLSIFITIMLGLPAPLTAVLILIVNTLTDVFPSLALSVEPVERNILERPPRKPDAKIMEKSFIRRYVMVGLLIGTVTAGTFIWGLMSHGWRFGKEVDLDSAAYAKSATMAFIILTLIQMVHAFICRSETISFFKMNHLKNLYLLAAVAFSTIMTVLVVQVPFFQKYLKTTPLTLREWATLVMLSFSILLYEEIRKFFMRRKLKMQMITSNYR